MVSRSAFYVEIRSDWYMKLNVYYFIRSERNDIVNVYDFIRSEDNGERVRL